MYYYRLRAFNDFGYSGFTDTVQVLIPDMPDTATDVQAPRLRVSRTTSNTVELTWVPSQNTNLRYTLRRVFGSSEGIIKQDLRGNSYLDEDLTPNTLYQYRIQVSDNNGNYSYSNSCEAITQPGFMQNRVNDSLIALYIFGQRKRDTIFDQSWYNTPVNLWVTDISNVKNNNSEFLQIESDNQLVSNLSEKISSACKLSNELTIECWIKTSDAISMLPSKILGLEDENQIAFSLSCIKNEPNSTRIRYFINLNTNTTDNNGKPDFLIEQPVESNVLHHIVFTHSHTGEESIFINNELAASGFRPPKFDSWIDQYTLVVANDLAENNPWYGNLYLFAIYNRSLEPSEIAQNYFASPFFSDSYSINPTDYSIYAYPNPANESIHLEFINTNVSNTEFTNNYSLSLFNQQGLLVHKEDVTAILSDGMLDINLSNLDNGVYTLVLTNPNGIITQKKIVIIH